MKAWLKKHGANSSEIPVYVSHLRELLNEDDSSSYDSKLCVLSKVPDPEGPKSDSLLGKPSNSLWSNVLNSKLASVFKRRHGVKHFMIISTVTYIHR